jgi:hypothetical protein
LIFQKVAGNPNGVWVVGNAKAINGGFSATVRWLTATNYPPKGSYTSASTLVFNGTPDYVVELNNAANQPATFTAATPYKVPAGSYVTSFTAALVRVSGSLATASFRSKSSVSAFRRLNSSSGIL